MKQKDSGHTLISGYLLIIKGTFADLVCHDKTIQELVQELEYKN